MFSSKGFFHESYMDYSDHPPQSGRPAPKQVRGNFYARKLQSQCLFNELRRGTFLSIQQAPNLNEESDGNVSRNKRWSGSGNKLAEPLLTLQREHESILARFTLIVEMMRNFSSVEKDHDSRARVAMQMQSLRTVLIDHASREEQILIPILSKVLEPGATASIETDHKRIVELLDSLLTTVSIERADSNLGLNGLVAELDSFLREHFSREENVLFWFASIQISK
jgi:iron-sulfur cluster repair protein YtfE (RIC family)